MKLPEKDVAEYIDLHGFAAIDELAEKFNVSEMTVRRCLLRLEDQGQIRRVRAGAIPGATIKIFGRGFLDNLYRGRVEKQEIARRAVELIAGAKTVFLDAGSTCYYVARLIPHDREMTVITHSADIIAVLRHKPHVRVVCPGGELDSTLNVFAGPHAERVFDSFTADVGLLGAGALDLRKGTQENVLVQIPIKLTINRNATVSHLLLDSSKFGRRSYFSGIPIDEISSVVTTERTDAAYISELQRLGIAVNQVAIPEPTDDGDEDDAPPDQSAFG